VAFAIKSSFWAAAATTSPSMTFSTMIIDGRLCIAPPGWFSGCGVPTAYLQRCQFDPALDRWPSKAALQPGWLADNSPSRQTDRQQSMSRFGSPSEWSSCREMPTTTSRRHRGVNVQVLTNPPVQSIDSVAMLPATGASSSGRVSEPRRRQDTRSGKQPAHIYDEIRLRISMRKAASALG